MAEAMVERRPLPRFFCYKCNVEFDHVSQDYLCPYCSGGFVEQLETERSEMTPPTTSDSESDMIAIEDPDDSSLEDPGQGLTTDLAFLMSNGRIRGVRGGINLGNTENLLQHILMAWSGDFDVGTSSPVVVVGTSPGDYVVGGESFDAVVTQLLGQLEGSGPPPLSPDRIAAIPCVEVTQEQFDSKLTCSVCWDAFNTGESVRRLECEHLYHGACIEPWLKLHGTCPVCRRSLVPEGQAAPSFVPFAPFAPPTHSPRGPRGPPGAQGVAFMSVSGGADAPTCAPACAPVFVPAGAPDATAPAADAPPAAPGAPGTPTLPTLPQGQIRTGVFRTFLEPHRDSMQPRITALLMRAAAHGARPNRGPYRMPRPRAPSGRTTTTQPRPNDSSDPNDSASPTAGYSMDIDFD